MRSIFKRVDLIQIAIILIAGCVFIIQAKAWPLAPGRDFNTYLSYYVQMWMNEPDDPRVMLFRTPIFPLFIGVLADSVGPKVIEYVVGTLFIISILTIYRIGREFDMIAGVVASILVLLYSAYGTLYHIISSDFLSSFIFILWTYYVVKTRMKHSIKEYTVHGLFLGLLIWTRPANLSLVLFMLYPLFISTISIREKLRLGCIFISIFFASYFLLSSYNYLRYGKFSFATGNEGAPFMKIYKVNKLIHPDNGPASLALAELVERELLKTEPYLKKKVTLEDFFTKNPTGRKCYDIIILSEKFPFPDKNPLRKIAIEAIIHDPITYIWLNAKDVMLLMLNVHQFTPAARHKDSVSNDVITPETLLETVNKRIQDNDSDDIALSYYIYEKYKNRDTLRKMAHLKNRIQALGLDLPLRQGYDSYAKFLNYLTSIYPGILWFIVVGLLCVIFRWEHGMISITIMTMLALLSVILASLTVNNVPHYRIIYDPIFIVFGVISMVRLVRKKFSNPYKFKENLYRSNSIA